MEALRQRFVGYVVRRRRPAGCGEQLARKREPAAQLKSAITGTYRAVRDKHVPRYLAEFEYRFNRRYDLAAVMLRLRLRRRANLADAVPSHQIREALNKELRVDIRH
jgi:hypothetical protein